MVKTSLVMLTVLQKCTDNLQPLNVLGLSILSGKENLDLAVKCKPCSYISVKWPLFFLFYELRRSLNNKPLCDSSAGGIL